MHTKNPKQMAICIAICSTVAAWSLAILLLNTGPRQPRALFLLSSSAADPAVDSLQTQTRRLDTSKVMQHASNRPQSG